MTQRKTISLPNRSAIFNPNKDRPLRYFNIDEAFVRKCENGGYKLYCKNGTQTPIYLAPNKFIYIYPAFTTDVEQYVEAFLHDYVPQYSYDKAKQYINGCHYEYIGNPQLTPC